MKVCCLAVLAVLIAATAVSATVPRLESVQKQALSGANEINYYTIPLDRIFQDARSTDTPPVRIWGAPLPATQSSPMSDRQLNLQWTPPAALVTSTNNAALTTVTGWLRNANRLRFNFAANLPIGTVLDVKLEAPYLEVDPSNCGASAGAMQNCRCNPGAAETASQEVRPYLTDAQKTVGTITLTAAASSIPVVLEPLNTFFEHAPFVGQNPFARTYRRLCYRTGGAASAWVDTRIMVAVTQGCLDGTADLATDTIGITSCLTKTNNTFLTVVQDAAGTPSFVAADDTRLGRLGDFYTTTAAGAVTFISAGNVGTFNGETGPMLVDRAARTACCGSSSIGVASPTEDTATITDPRFGVCINPTLASCCGRRAYQTATEKCCSRPNSRINYLDQPCDCSLGGTLTTEQVNAFCQFQGPNVFVSGDQAGATQAASSTTFTCCAQTRFPELNSVTLEGAATPAYTRFQRSFCASSTAADGFQCCSDGNVFDIGSQQCCPVTGVQSLNVPCPCGSSGDCPLGSGCCFQIFPPGLPRGQGASQCSRYANFPRIDNGGFDTGDVILSVPGVPQAQRCPGTCYNLQYQMCCNGAVCESGFTRCCNDTCCNKFSETCQLSQRSPLNSLSNSRDLGVYFEMCSRIELLSGRKAFFVFVLPAWLLLATAVSLALVTVLARRATEHIFELTERAIVFLALFTVVLGCPFFFSPFYKNGIVIVLVGLVSILVAVARKRKASLFLVILLVAAIFYVINPFAGNIYFSITSAVPVYGARPEPSLLEAAQNLWRTSENCVAFYDFFLYDPALRDQRLDNPEDFTFGYCSRSYITALIIFAIALYVVLLLLLLLAVFSLVKKLGIKAVEPIELEVAMEPELVY